jgi:hypothetical protein
MKWADMGVVAHQTPLHDLRAADVRATGELRQVGASDERLRIPCSERIGPSLTRAAFGGTVRRPLDRVAGEDGRRLRSLQIAARHPPDGGGGVERRQLLDLDPVRTRQGRRVRIEALDRVDQRRHGRRRANALGGGAAHHPRHDFERVAIRLIRLPVKRRDRHVGPAEIAPAGVIHSRGTPVHVDAARLDYADGRAEAGAVIAALLVALDDGSADAPPPELDQRWEIAIAERRRLGFGGAGFVLQMALAAPRFCPLSAISAHAPAGHRMAAMPGPGLGRAEGRGRLAD